MTYVDENGVPTILKGLLIRLQSQVEDIDPPTDEAYDTYDTYDAIDLVLQYLEQHL